MNTSGPRYEEGQIVRTQVDLVNDGSFPDAPPDALLVPAGTQGEIVKVGMTVDSATPVYLVDFNRQIVVGCLEAEILPLQARNGTLAGVMID